jgi:hypothetical protein
LILEIRSWFQGLQNQRRRLVAIVMTFEMGRACYKCFTTSSASAFSYSSCLSAVATP